MQLAPKPYTVHPYDELKKMGCPWIDDVRTRVLKRIDEFNAFIKAEAEADGQPELADEEFLYERFKDNCEYGLVMGNLRLLKYFALWFKVKLLYEMIGDWKFTVHDKDMYLYFRQNNFENIKVFNVNKLITYNLEDVPQLFVHDNTSEWFIKYTDETGYTVNDFYVNIYRHEYIMFDDMMRNTKNLELIIPTDIMFVDRKFPKVCTTVGNHIRKIPSNEKVWVKYQYDVLYRKKNKFLLINKKHEYYETNKDKMSLKHKERYEANKDVISAQTKAYREANKDKIAASRKAYWEANKEKMHAKKKAYREANKDKIAASRKAYREANKDKIHAQEKARREAHKEYNTKYRKMYYESNKDDIRAKQKAYCEANKDKIAAYKKAWQEANKDRLLAKRKDWEEANKDVIRAKQKAYREANKEKLAVHNKAYREANKYRLYAQAKAKNDSKRAAGYRYRKDPETGKHKWIFVGNN